MLKLLVRKHAGGVVEALKHPSALQASSAETKPGEIMRDSSPPCGKSRSFKEALADMPYFNDDDLFDVN